MESSIGTKGKKKNPSIQIFKLRKVAEYEVPVLIMLVLWERSQYEKGMIPKTKEHIVHLGHEPNSHRKVIQKQKEKKIDKHPTKRGLSEFLGERDQV